MKKITALLLSLFLATMTAPLLAAGLTANFGEVLIDKLQIGHSFSIRDKANLPYIVTNVSNNPIDIKVEVIVPKSKDLKKGYDPIPDPSWIKLEKNFFTLNPKEQGTTDIVFNIPNDEKLLGKKFDAIIYPYTYEGILKIGVNSHILFTIDTVKTPYVVYPDTKTFKDKNAFDLSPMAMQVKDIPLGKTVDLKKHDGTILKITNTTDQKVKFFMNTIKVKNSAATLKKEYEDTPDPLILSFSEEVLTIDPKQAKEVGLYLTFPNDKKYAGKNYMFVIAVVLGEQEAPLVRYAYVYVTTKK